MSSILILLIGALVLGAILWLEVGQPSKDDRLRKIQTAYDQSAMHRFFDKIFPES